MADPGCEDHTLLLDTLGWLLAEVVAGETMWWSPELKDEFDERAGIREYDGGMPRRDAEIMAFCEIARRHPEETKFRGAGDGSPLAPECVRLELSDGEFRDLAPDELYVALYEASVAIARTLEGDQIDDTDGMQLLRFVTTVRAGPRALEELLWRAGEALEDV